MKTSTSKTPTSARKARPARRRMLAAGLVVSGLLALGGALPASAAPPAGAKVGAKCTVTSGPNKGKTGTYTRDEYGKLWCEGPWGGTACVSKCKNGLVLRSTLPTAPATGMMLMTW